jgi:hypothetical protein
MPEYLTQNEAFLKCRKLGKFISIEEIDIEKIKSTLAIAEGDIEAGCALKKNSIKGTNHWNSIYKLYYDALHELVEAYLRFDKIKSDSHQCLFSYLCEKHPELEFNWDFFEKVRTKRNGINYYGTPITQDDWKEIELQLNLYLTKLKGEIKSKIFKYDDKI